MTLRDVLLIWRRHLALLIIAPVLVGAAMGWHTARTGVDVYYASATLYILLEQDHPATAEDSSDLTSSLYVSEFVAHDIADLLMSDRANELLATELGARVAAPYTYSAVSGERSRIVWVMATSPDPDTAIRVANTIPEVADELAREIIGVESVNVIDEATPPAEPIEVDVAGSVVRAAGAALVVTAAVVLAASKLDPRVRVARDAERASGITCAGAVHRAASLRKGGEGPLDDGTDQLRREVQAVATELLLACEPGPRAIAVCSAEEGAGRSTVALAAAWSLAVGGTRVLLVEGDPSNPVLASWVGVQPQQGVRAVASGEASLAEAVCATSRPGLDLLASELWLADSTTPCSVHDAGRIVAEARARYDVIVIDTAPAATQESALAFAAHADVVMVLARPGVTRRRALARLADWLRATCDGIGAVVMNDVKPRRAHRRRRTHRR